MRREFFKTVTGALLVFSLLAGPARAADPKLIARHDRWGAYVIDENGGKVCYMASHPARQDGVKFKRGRGDVYALITHRPGEGTRNVFSYVAGYVYKTGSKASLTIDGKSFELFTKDDSAWAKTAETDAVIAGALRQGKMMTVKGISAHGSATTDTFTLAGAKEAYADIGRACQRGK